MAARSALMVLRISLSCSAKPEASLKVSVHLSLPVALKLTSFLLVLCRNCAQINAVKQSPVYIAKSQTAPCYFS